MEKCLSIKGAEDVINKPHAFEISTHSESMYFIADTDKEKVGHLIFVHAAPFEGLQRRVEQLHKCRHASSSTTLHSIPAAGGLDQFCRAGDRATLQEVLVSLPCRQCVQQWCLTLCACAVHLTTRLT